MRPAPGDTLIPLFQKGRFGVEDPARSRGGRLNICRRGLCFAGRFARRLAFAFLAFDRLGFEQDFGGLPVALRFAFRAALIKPEKVSELPDAVLTISHGWPRIGWRSARYCVCG